jgi:hypothetical protein
MIQIKNTCFAWVIFILLPVISFAQTSPALDSVAIQNKTSKVPSKYRKEPAKLAHFLADEYSDEASQVLAFSYWITKNISYDYDAHEDRTKPGLTSHQVLRSNHAVCGEYAQLFTDMCEAVGIKSAVVGGYTKGFDFFSSDTLYRAEHAWSVVKIDGVWMTFDLTWASGYSVYKEQFLSNLLWKLFRVPFEHKRKNVQEFDPKYIFMDPQELIYTHKPMLAIFQLLENPVPHNVYTQGDSAIASFNTGNCSEYDNSQIDHFLKKQKVAQYLEIGNKGYFDNLNNHRVKGYYYYKAGYQFYENNYNQKQKVINTTSSNLNDFENYLFVADEFLNLAKMDVETEYLSVETRSLGWKSSVQIINKKLIKDVGNRRKEGKAQVSMAYKLVDFHTKTYDGLTLAIKKNKGRKPVVLRPQRNSSLLNEALAQSYLAMADSLDMEAQKLVQMQIGLLSEFPLRGQYEMYKKEAIINTLHAANIDSLDMEVQNKINYYSLIYLDNNFIQKRWFMDEFKKLDSLNLNVVKKGIVGLKNNLDKSNDYMKSYKKIMTLAMKKVKLANKVSDKGECKKLYDEYRSKLTTHTIEYRTMVGNYLLNNDDFIAIIEEEDEAMETAQGALKRESSYESIRHKNYMKYRKNIKKGELSLIKAMDKQVVKMERVLAKTKTFMGAQNNQIAER